MRQNALVVRQLPKYANLSTVLMRFPAINKLDFAMFQSCTLEMQNALQITSTIYLSLLGSSLTRAVLYRYSRLVSSQCCGNWI